MRAFPFHIQYQGLVLGREEQTEWGEEEAVERESLPPFPPPKVLFSIFIYLSIYLSIYLFIYFWLCWVFVAARGLFSSCGERGLLFVAVRRFLIAVASLVAEHGL